MSVIIELLFKAIKCCGYSVMTKLVGHVASGVPCKVILDLNVLIYRTFEAKSLLQLSLIFQQSKQLVYMMFVSTVIAHRRESTFTSIGSTFTTLSTMLLLSLFYLPQIVLVLIDIQCYLVHRLYAGNVHDTVGK